MPADENQCTALGRRASSLVGSFWADGASALKFRILCAMTDRLAGLGRIAAEAGALAQSERGRIVLELKGDGSIVTNGDRAVETLLRERLPALVPGSTVWGEEFGFEDAGPGGRWVVDPIDGTSNYSFGSPLWGVSIALEVGGRIVLGAVNLADLGEMYLAEDGKGALLNGEPLDPLAPGPIRAEELTGYNEHVAALFEGVPGKQRLSGAFVVDGTFVAKGRFRALVAMRERLYDVAACVLIARELGADVRYIDGSPFEERDLMRNERIGRPWGILPRESGFVVADK